MTREDFIAKLDEILDLSLETGGWASVYGSVWDKEVAALADKIFPMSDPSCRLAS